MKHRVKVVQTLRVEKSIIIELEADSMAEAIEAVSSGEIDLPSPSDDGGQVWQVERISLEDEDYLPGLPTGVVALSTVDNALQGR